MNPESGTCGSEELEKSLFNKFEKCSFWSSEISSNDTALESVTLQNAENLNVGQTVAKACSKARSLSPLDFGNAKRMCPNEIEDRCTEEKENIGQSTLDHELHTLKLSIKDRIDYYLDKELNESRKAWDDFFRLPAMANTICVTIPVTDFSEMKLHSIKVIEEIVKRKGTVEEAEQIKNSYKQKNALKKEGDSQNEASRPSVKGSSEDPANLLQNLEQTSSRRTSKRSNRVNATAQEGSDKVAVAAEHTDQSSSNNNTDVTAIKEPINQEEEIKLETVKSEEPDKVVMETQQSLETSVEPSANMEAEVFSKPKRSARARVRFTAEETASNENKKDQVQEEPVKTMTTIKELDKSDNEFGISVSGEVIGIKKLLSQYQVPLMNSYLSTPFNIRIADATELQNCPYLGDELDEGKKKFLDDLIYNFEGKLRAWDQIEDMPPPLFVEVVQLIWKSFGVDLSDPSIDLRDPPFYVINRLGQLFSNDDHIKLRERYINFTSDKEVVKTLKDVTDPGIAFPREKAMETLLKFFCRRCYVYDCEMHDPVNLPPVEKHPSDIPRNQLPCKNSCYMEHYTCLYFCKSEPMMSKPHLCAKNWSNSEVTLLNVLAPGHGKDICNLSTCFPLKNCTQVFLKLLENGSVTKLCEDESIEKVTKEIVDSFEDLRLQPEVVETPARFEYKPGVFFNKRDETDLVNKVLSKQQNLTKHPYYQPCYHKDSETLCGVGNEKCDCVSKNSFCDKSCGCSLDCPNRFPGCRCTKLGCQSKSSCLCLMARRECDPDLCLNCCALTELPFTDKTLAPFTHQLPDPGDIPAEVTPEVVNEYVKQSGFNHCKNFNLQCRQRNAKVMLGVSEVAGWGIFATMPFRPGDFIGEYRGEVVSHNEAERRGQMYDRNFNSYLFGLNSDFVVDATVKGCKMRFINHADKPNCSAKVLQVCGDHKIGIFASKNIKPGHELFYNYRYSGRHKKKKGEKYEGSESEEENSEEWEEEEESAEDNSSCSEEPSKRNTGIKFSIAEDDCD